MENPLSITALQSIGLEENMDLILEYSLNQEGDDAMDILEERHICQTIRAPPTTKVGRKTNKQK